MKLYSFTGRMIEALTASAILAAGISLEPSADPFDPLRSLDGRIGRTKSGSSSGHTASAYPARRGDLPDLREFVYLGRRVRAVLTLRLLYHRCFGASQHGVPL